MASFEKWRNRFKVMLLGKSSKLHHRNGLMKRLLLRLLLPWKLDAVICIDLRFTSTAPTTSAPTAPTTSAPTDLRSRLWTFPGHTWIWEVTTSPPHSTVKPTESLSQFAHFQLVPYKNCSDWWSPEWRFELQFLGRLKKQALKVLPEAVGTYKAENSPQILRVLRRFCSTRNRDQYSL